MGLGVVYAQNYPGPFEAAKFRIPPGTTTARAKVAGQSFQAIRRVQNKSVQATRGEGEIVTFKHHFNDFTRTEIPAQ